MRNAKATYASSVSTDVAAYEDLSGHHLLAVQTLIATTNNESYHGSASELPPTTSHGYADWNISSVPDPVLFQWFLDASSIKSYDPARSASWSSPTNMLTTRTEQGWVTETRPKT
jgi:hypothetical protein